MPVSVWPRFFMRPPRVSNGKIHAYVYRGHGFQFGSALFADLSHGGPLSFQVGNGSRRVQDMCLMQNGFCCQSTMDVVSTDTMQMGEHAAGWLSLSLAM